MIADAGSFPRYLQAAVEVSKRSPELIQLLDMHMHFAASTPGRKVFGAFLTPSTLPQLPFFSSLVFFPSCLGFFLPPPPRAADRRWFRLPWPGAIAGRKQTRTSWSHTSSSLTSGMSGSWGGRHWNWLVRSEADVPTINILWLLYVHWVRYVCVSGQSAAEGHPLRPNKPQQFQEGQQHTGLPAKVSQLAFLSLAALAWKTEGRVAAILCKSPEQKTLALTTSTFP